MERVIVVTDRNTQTNCSRPRISALPHQFHIAMQHKAS
jgi:hypothetical protein